MDPGRTRVIHRDLNRTYSTLVRGEGIYLYDDEGNRYIDASGGSAAVTAIGHGVPEVVNALADQAARLAYAPTHAFATENAVKMAVQYHRERGNGSRHLVIGRRSSFHGATIAALGFGGNAARRRPFAAILAPAEHITPCNPYRCRANGACPACDLSCADELEFTIRQVGPDNVAAFIAEPVVGATLGVVPATPGYFQRIREICDH